MHPFGSINFIKGYILGPKMVEVWQGLTPSRDTWDFFQHKFNPLNTQHQFYFI